jgi:hypothetical protein
VDAVYTFKLADGQVRARNSCAFSIRAICRAECGHESKNKGFLNILCVDCIHSLKISIRSLCNGREDAIQGSQT